MAVAREWDMGMSSFDRLAGVALASVALVIAVAWLAMGATIPPSFESLAAASKDNQYVAFEYTGTDDQVSEVLKKLSTEGYQAVDASAGRRSGDEHDILILKGFSQPEAVATLGKLIREYGHGGGNIGPLQEQYFLRDMSRGKYPFGRLFAFAMSQAEPVASRALLFVITASVIAAALLAMLLLVRGVQSGATRRLGLGLGCWAASVAYLWMYSVAPGFDRFQPEVLAARITFDVLAFALLFAASLLYIRFWKSYPQPISDEELTSFLVQLKAEQWEKAQGATHRWVSFAARKSPATAATDLNDVTRGAVAVDRRRYLKLTLIAAAVLLAGLAWTGGFTMPGPIILPAIPFAFLVLILLTYWPGLTCLRIYRYHRTVGSAEDSRKIEWIWAAVWITFVAILLPCVLLAFMYLGRYFDPELEAYEHLADTLFIFGLTSGPLFVILALAVSILYRGTIDPRLALRGVTMWSVMGILLTLVFVLVERSIAVRLARWWGLAPQTGYVTAGAIVAATFQPVRKRAEKQVNRFVERVMPTSMLSSGTRKTAAVAVVDITGYTALSAKDEQSALLASALVQKEARRLGDALGGRVVKSTGDGVIMDFKDAEKALEAITQLHQSVRKSAAVMNLPEVSLHSGLHWGEVVEMRDGDIYGMTVNLAARLADWAKAGEIGMSQVFHDGLQSGTPAFENFGPQSFKNVPEPLTCFKLRDA